MGWVLFQEVPECPESHHFPSEVFLTQRVQRERMEGRERMNQPVTACISFLLRGQESGFTSCCSSLWPPEGRVQVSHSGAAVSSAQVCRGAESRTRLDAEVLAQRGNSWRCREATFCSQIELWPECSLLVSLDVWSEAKACPGAPICASVWLLGLRGVIVTKTASL